MAHSTSISTSNTPIINHHNTNIISKITKLCLYENELIPGLPNDMALECLLRVPITSHPTLRLVSNNWKTTLSHPQFYSLRQRSALAEHLVFLIQPMSPPSTPLSTSSSSKMSAKVGEVQEAGSKEIDNCQSPLLYNLSVYNSTSQEWRGLGDITIPTFAQCVALPKFGKVILLGGWDPALLEPVPRVLIIDLSTGTWKEGSPMKTVRSFFACVLVGPATVYVAGGHDGQKNALRTAEAYDVEADQWRALPDMAEERDESHGLLLSDDSKFWVISGYGTESQGRFRSDAEIYDPETNTWSHQDGVWPYPGHTPKSTAVAAVQTQQHRWICMIGGEMKFFDFKDNFWKALNLGLIPKSVSGSSSFSLIDMGDDRIMVMGNGEKCGEECKEKLCGGEGVFMVEKTKEENNKGAINWSWQHVHAPSRYLGFPFFTSHLFI